MGATLQISRLIKIEEEKRHFGKALLLQLGLVALFDLLKVKNCLPLRVWLVRPTESACHLCFMPSELRLQFFQLLLDCSRNQLGPIRPLGLGFLLSYDRSQRYLLKADVRAFKSFSWSEVICLS